MALDRYGRRIHYLRISLTDRCNLRCVYCMPEDVTFRPNAELLQDDEIITLVRLFARLGVDKIRLTGGEPTVRPNVVDLVREIAATPGIRSLSMTTNGVLLSRLAQPLAQAGLQRVNISLDTLNPEKYKYLTRWGNFDEVWRGVLAAEEAGLTPIKINCVIVKNCNENDILDLARLTMDRPWQLRFIEMMPLAGATNVQMNRAVLTDDVMDQIKKSLGPLESLNGGKLDGEAKVFRMAGAKGEIGFISSVSEPFCWSCTRIRLTADGRLRLCLLRDDEIDLLTPLRAGASHDDLRQLIVEGIWKKPWGHLLSEGVVAESRVMNQIGG